MRTALPLAALALGACVSVAGLSGLEFEPVGAGGASSSSVGSGGTAMSSGGAGGSSAAAGGAGGSAGGEVAPYALMVLDASPVAYYPLDDDPLDLVISDRSGFERDATVQLGSAAPASVDGAIAGSMGMRFSGGTQAEVNLEAFRFTDRQPFSIELWLAAIFDNSYFGPVVACTEDSSQGYSIPVDFNAGAVTAAVSFYRLGDQGNQNARAANALPADGQAYVHVVVTYDGSFSRVFIDGELRDGNDAPDVAISPHMSSLRFGVNEGAGSATVVLDELALYDRALSLAEIAAHHLCGSTGACGD